MQYHFLVEPSQEKPLTSLTLSMLQSKVGITRRETHTKQLDFQGIDPVSLYINTPCLLFVAATLNSNATLLCWYIMWSPVHCLAAVDKTKY